MIFSPLLLAARRFRGFLSSSSRSSLASGDSLSAKPPGAAGRIVLSNDNHRLEFNPDTAQLVSLRSAQAPDMEFVPANDHHPVFVIQYLDHGAEFHQIASTQAKDVRVRKAQRVSVEGHHEDILTADFGGIGGLDLAATVTVRISAADSFSYWSISIQNHASLFISDVQFPFILTSYQLAGAPNSEAILQPYSNGRLFMAPKPQDLEPDSPHAWQFRPENGDTSHYPGSMFAQFLAYYNDRAGVYLACLDTSGSIKLIKPVHSDPGIRLGVAHVGDWPTDGERRLEYDVALRTFSGEGDWYTPAEIYRDWSLKQKWAAAPLHKRQDVPEWLLDSPPHIIVRIQGRLDQGPTNPNAQFLPYPKIVPLLEKISTRIDAPVVGVIMAWERPGPWIYPDCFPPAGGDESLHEFTNLMRERGWHVGSFCNGTRWVIHHFWSDYDGRRYFAEHEGSRVVCKTHHQQPWREWWDQTWRPSYACCLGVPETRRIAGDFIRHLVHDGLDWVQFLDQNVGCSTFPCYAPDHGHPAYPGRWMTTGMQALTNEFRAISNEVEKGSRGERKLAFSVEQPPNEFFMANFQICDARVIPPGHTGWEREFIPLYHFLYHEFVLIQGGFGSAPEPYHMPIRTAYNLVVGEIPGGVITGEGRLLNKDTFNWAPWNPPVGNNDDSLEGLKRATALRRGKAKDFLVYGRMQRPAAVKGVTTMKWEYNGVLHHIPAVFHSAWHDPDGTFGLVLANWTTEAQTVQISDPRLGKQFIESISASVMRSRVRRMSGEVSVSLPSLSCALIEAEV